MELERAISLYASAIKNWALLRKQITGGRSTGTTHLGFPYVEKANHHDVATRVLQTNWHGRKAVGAMFEMAESVQALLHPDLRWEERMNLGRYLCSCLTMSYLYYLDKDDVEDVRSPWRLVNSDKK